MTNNSDEDLSIEMNDIAVIVETHKISTNSIINNAKQETYAEKDKTDLEEEPAELTQDDSNKKQYKSQSIEKMSESSDYAKYVAFSA